MDPAAAADMIDIGSHPLMLLSRGRMDARAQGNAQSKAAVSRQSMRAFLSVLADAGDLVTIPEPVSLDYDVAACLAQADGGPALQFQRVTGAAGDAALPVVGNLLNSLPRFALGMGSTVRAMQGALIAAIEKPLPHRVVATAPCQEQVVETPSLSDALPIPRFFEKEGGPYITAGAIVAKDRATGQANLSIARLMPLGGNRAFVGIAPNHHLAIMARAAHARGEKLDIAVCIGNHPAVLVASCLYLGLGDDELPIAGALLGEPLDVVRCTHPICWCLRVANACWRGRLMPANPSWKAPSASFTACTRITVPVSSRPSRA